MCIGNKTGRFYFIQKKSVFIKISKQDIKSIFDSFYLVLDSFQDTQPPNSPYVPFVANGWALGVSLKNTCNTGLLMKICQKTYNRTCLFSLCQWVSILSLKNDMLCTSIKLTRLIVFETRYPEHHKPIHNHMIWPIKCLHQWIIGFQVARNEAHKFLATAHWPISLP